MKEVHDTALEVVVELEIGRTWWLDKCVTALLDMYYVDTGMFW